MIEVPAPNDEDTKKKVTDNGHTVADKGHKVKDNGDVMTDKENKVTDNGEEKKKTEGKVVNSNIISASINGRNERVELSQPMYYTLEHKTVSFLDD